MINYQNRNPKLKVPTHSLRTSRRQRVSPKVCIFVHKETFSVQCFQWVTEV